MTYKEIETIKIWGIKLNPLKFDEFIKTVENKIENSAVIHITGVNPETVVHAQSSVELKDSIINSDLVNIDNFFIVFILRILGYKIPCRIATPDLFEFLLKIANERRLKVFILGSKKHILEKAIYKIKATYPNLKINGHHGYFDSSNESSIVNLISDYSPDLFFISMPSPYKESFILRYKNTIKSKVFLGIGGAIDVKAGIVRRPPLFLRNIALEGLFRSIQNPLNYGMRYIKYYPKFLKIVIYNKSER